LLKEEIPRDVELRTHDPAASRLEAIIARGDRDVAALLEEAWRRGARFDAWSERFDRGLWAAAEDATLRSPERYLGTLDPAAALPWDHVDLGVTKRWLQGEWARALEGVMSPACDPRGTPPRCTGCGVGCLPAGDLRGGGSPVTAERAEPPAGDPPPPAEAVTPIRIRYRRVPPATVLGHLDLQRSLCRGLRRAGLPLEHTRGYHPRLKTSAGPSLPLGAWGLDEWLEVGFLGQPAEGWGALAPALQRVMIDGIEILDVAPRGPGPKPPAPTAFEWLVRLGRAPVAGELAAARIRWARDGLSCDRKGARRDLAAAVLDVEVALHLPAGVPPAAGALRLRLRAEAAPRPEEIVMDLGFSREELLSVIRVGATPS
ncbi:MAG: DUF2344 domain-containing protein, partial [Deltaproteobacteria bacterium]|nr:DUF2344 domain-containing protein [Deltaproteobacteria bacterium]